MSFAQFPSQQQAQAPQQMYQQYSQQPSQYGQPPQGWAPQGQPPMNGGWTAQGFPPQQGYPYQSPPPQQFQQPQYQFDEKLQPAPTGTPMSMAPQQQQYPQQFQQPQQSQQANFRWSTASSALNDTVRDPTGREVFSIQTPKKKETIVSGASGQVIAKIEWSSTPIVSLHGGKAMKIKDWLPFDKQAGCRVMRHQGDSYRFVDQNQTVLIFKNNSPSPIGILSDPNDITDLQLSPEALPLLEDFIVITTIFQSGHNIEKSGWFSGPSFQMGMIGGIGGAVAASS